MQVEWTPRAIRALNRRLAFLRRKSPRAARVANETVLAASQRLATFPSIGRPYSLAPALYRELIVPFGSGGYVLLYRILPDRVVITRVKHQREASY